jgi:hypothetical protein
MSETTRHVGTLKNVNPKSLAGGSLVINIITAEVLRRDHLRDGVIAISWTADGGGGVGVHARDAGIRQHLANALDLPKDVVLSTGIDGRRLSGRVGTFHGLTVHVYNLV